MIVAFAALAGTGALSISEVAQTREGARAGEIVTVPRDMQGAIAIAKARRAELMKRRATPAAKRARQRSRRAFGELSGREALALARKRFGVLSAPTWTPPEPVADGNVKRYLDDSTLIADVPGRRDAVVRSTLPLRATDEAGELAPLDLALRDEGGHYEVANPLVETAIDKDPSGGVALEGGIGVDVASGGDSAGRRVDGKVFYADTATATDTFVAPTPTGIETFSHLRSAASPETHVLDFELPRGARLDAVRGDSTVIRGRDGSPIGGITPPVAADSDGLEVPTSARVVGDRLVIRVAHRGGDFRYPVLLDPVIESFRWHCPTVNGQDQSGYDCYRDGRPENDHSYADTNGFEFRKWPKDGNPIVGEYNQHEVYGIGIYAPPSSSYRDGEYGGWVWRAPGDSFIYRAEFGLFKWQAGSGQSAWQGIGPQQDKNADGTPKAPFPGSDDAWYGRWNWQWNGGHYSEGNVRLGLSPWYSWSTETGSFRSRTHCLLDGCTWGDPGVLEGPNEWRMFIMGTPGSRGAAWVTLGAAYMYLHDWNAPRWLNTGDTPPPWWVENHSFTPWLEARDPGLGMKSLQMRVIKPDGSAWQERRSDNPCPGGNAHPGGSSTPAAWNRCDDHHSAPFPIYTDDWPEGVNWVEIRAEDVIGHQVDWTRGLAGSADAWQNGAGGKPIKIDRSQPKAGLGLGGDLYTKAGQWFKGGTHKVTWKAEDQFSGVQIEKLEIERATGDTNSASGWTALVDKYNNCGPTGCPQTPPAQSFDWNTAGYADGDRKFKLTAKDPLAAAAPDPAKHTRTEPWTIRLDTGLPIVAPNNELWDARDKITTKSTLRLDVAATDSSKPVNSGVERIEVYVGRNGQFEATPRHFRDQPEAGDNKPLSAAFTFRPKRTDEGWRTIKIVARDRAKNEASRQWNVFFDMGRPVAYSTSHSTPARLGWTTGNDNAQVVGVRGEDVGSGIQRITSTHTDSDGPHPVTREPSPPCTGLSGSPCPNVFDTTFTYDLTKFPEGRNYVRARAYDAAGQESRSYQETVKDTPGLRAYWRLGERPFNDWFESLNGWSYDAGAGTFTSVNGQLVPSSTGEKTLYRPEPQIDAHATLEFQTGVVPPGVSAVGLVLRRLNANNLLHGTVNPEGQLSIWKKDNGVWTRLAQLARPALAANTRYWVRFGAVGNALNVRLYVANPRNGAEFVSSLDHTLSGANADKFGAGVAGNAGFRVDQAPLDYRYESFRLDPLTATNVVAGTEQSDEFDSLAGWTFDAGAGTLTAADGQLTPSNNAEKNLYRPEHLHGDTTATLDFRSGATHLGHSAVGVILRRLNANNFVYGMVAPEGAMAIWKKDNGVWTRLAVVGRAALAAHTRHWVRFGAAGNALTVNLYTTDPRDGGSPVATINHTLTGADATKFGAGVVGHAGIRTDQVPVDYSYEAFRVDLRSPHASYLGAVDLDRSGAVGDANSAPGFDGGYVSAPDRNALDVTDRLSLEAWFKRNGTTDQMILGKGQNGYLLWISSGTLYLRKSHVGNIAAASQTPAANDGNWHHVVATKEGGTVRIYIDGVNRTGTVTNQTLQNNAEPLNIGTNVATDSERWRGEIDDVAIYDRPLSQEEVTAHWRAATTDWAYHIDRTAPEISFTPGSTLNRGGETLWRQEYRLGVRATDGVPEGADSQRRSGARRINISTRRVGTGGWDLRRSTGDVACPQDSCALDLEWTVRPEQDLTEAGAYDVWVEAYDHVGNRSEERFVIVVPPANPITNEDPMIGLEDWWQYDSTPTGAGSAAHVNLKTGNLIWHSVPVVNSGRGLSSVVNLTYNSHRPVQRPLIDTPLERGVAAYDEVGNGFSLGTSSLTRLNERLNVDLADIGRITLTDPDGTLHLFTAPADNTEVFTAPRGVQLHLRRFSRTLLGVPDALGYVPLEDPDRAWAATRPDGVTFYFDQRGYQTFIEDRNGNRLTFEYEYRGVTSSICQAAADTRIFVLPELACPRKLARLQDPGGREIAFNYRQEVLPAGEMPLPEINLPGLPPVGEPVDCDENGNIDIPLPLPEDMDVEPPQCASGQLSSIRDHLGRLTSFHYGRQGYLCAVTLAAGRADSRQFDLDYERQQGDQDWCEAPEGIEVPSLPLKNRPLVSVNDPIGGTTKFGYRNELTDPATELLAFARRINSIVDRAEEPKADEPREENGQPVPVEQPTRFAYPTDWQTIVTDTRGFPTTHDFVEEGDLGRIREITDANGHRTRIVWDDQDEVSPTDDNNVATITRHAGGGNEAATTRLLYNENGMLLSSTDPLEHTTTLDYDDSSGAAQHRSPRTQGDPANSIDAGHEFVSDIARITTPKGGQTQFFYDNNNGSHIGNVTERRDAEDNSAFTTYGANGVVASETDEEENVTEYRDYDLNGLPQTVEDAGDYVWRYEYDAAGNLTAATDPRSDGHVCQTTPARLVRHQTRFEYDSFDNVVESYTPKNSAECKFIHRSFRFDRNGNRTQEIDGHRAGATTVSYTRMDLPERWTSLPVSHFGRPTNESEVSEREYDSEGNVTEVTAPNGTVTGTAGDFVTQFGYDPVGQRISAVRLNSAGNDSEGKPRRLATGFAYDGRGNVIGISDAAHNAVIPEGETEPNPPEQNALDPTGQRWTYEYDLADNRRLAVEVPASTRAVDDPRRVGDLRTEYTYDANDNLETVTDPRGTVTPEDEVPEDFETRYEYDRRDLLTAITNPERETTSYERRADGKLAVQVTPRGNAAGGVGFFRTVYDYFPTGQLRSVTLPAAPNQYAPATPQVVYERNAVGDPIAITDPRGNKFHNTFFDTGDLRSTNRPSWWTFSPGGSSGGAGGDPLMNDMAAPGPPEPGISRPRGQISERPLEEQLADSGDTPELPQSEGFGDYGAVEAQAAPEILPRATPGEPGFIGSTWFDYDGEMRLERVDLHTQRGSRPLRWATLDFDDMGRLVKTIHPFDGERTIENEFAYDFNGNVRSHTDPRGAVSAFEYDQFDREVVRTEPGSVAPEVTKFTYDANNNLIARNLPRGTLTWRMRYDDIDRQIAVIDPRGAEAAADGDDAAAEPFTTHFDYDAVGNLVSKTSPQDRRATYGYDDVNRLTRITDPLGIVTRFEYDADGNQTRMVEPGAESGDIVTERTFDGRGRQWTETVGTEERRTTVKEWDGNGNLRRIVKPAGVDPATRLPRNAWNGATLTRGSNATENATVREYSPDNLLTSINMPYGDPDGDGGAPADDRRVRQEFVLDHRGRIRQIHAPFEWGNRCNEDAPRDDEGCSNTSTYDYYDSDWIRSMSDPTVTDPNDEDTPPYHLDVEYDYDEAGNQTEWTSPREQTDRRHVRRTFYDNGLLRTRSANTSDGSIPRRVYEHHYNPNGSMTRLTENLVGENEELEPLRTIRITYNELDQEILVDEEAPGRDTAFAYDRDGLVTSRRTDGTVREEGDPGSYRLGKTTSFEYDLAGREHIMRVCPEGEPEEGEDEPAPTPAVCTADYDPRGTELRTTVTNYYEGSGFIHTRTKPNDVVETYDFRDDGQISRMRRRNDDGDELKDQEYDYDLNGNRNQDERGDHVFNARDQLIAWTRSEEHVEGAEGEDPAVGGSRVCYELLPDASIRRERDTRTEAADPDGIGCENFFIETTYEYAQNRSQLNRTVSDGPSFGEPGIADYDYDDFGNVEQITATPGEDGREQDVTTYRYDQFGRMIRSRGPEPDDDNRDYRYDPLDRRDIRLVGEGDDQERYEFGYIGLTEKLSREERPGDDKLYDYDSRLSRQGQDTKGTTVSRYRSYAKDVNGSVEGLERDEDGEFEDNDRYRYDPYGELEDDEDDLGEAAHDNPFRFQGFYYDSAIKTYDMQARAYRPDVGRFLSQDRYESASGDLTLQVDPISQNRYAFAGGNPVNQVEWDGHMLKHDHGVCRTRACKKKKRRQRSGNSVGRAIEQGAAGIPSNPFSGPPTAVESFVEDVVNTPPPAAPAEQGPACVGCGQATLKPADVGERDPCPGCNQYGPYGCDPGVHCANEEGRPRGKNFGKVVRSGISACAWVFTPCDIADSVIGVTQEDMPLWKAGVGFLPLGDFAKRAPTGGGRGGNPSGPGTRSANNYGGLSHADDYGVWPYKTLKSDLKGTGLEAHHLIEKRFAGVLGQSKSDMPAIAVTKAEHQAFTNAWRREIPYGDGTRMATRAEIEAAASRIYANHPEIRRALGLP